ncbi:hypothetical protein CTA2_3913 [Colletotrichum tanaceti]|nr:hypothetical protein CTA2_3913 [Colletotrichum tanaceti]
MRTLQLGPLQSRLPNWEGQSDQCGCDRLHNEAWPLWGSLPYGLDLSMQPVSVFLPAAALCVDPLFSGARLSVAREGSVRHRFRSFAIPASGAYVVGAGLRQQSNRSSSSITTYRQNGFYPWSQLFRAEACEEGTRVLLCPRADHIAPHLGQVLDLPDGQGRRPTPQDRHGSDGRAVDDDDRE